MHISHVWGMGDNASMCAFADDFGIMWELIVFLCSFDCVQRQKAFSVANFVENECICKLITNNTYDRPLLFVLLLLKMDKVFLIGSTCTKRLFLHRYRV